MQYFAEQEKDLRKTGFDDKSCYRLEHFAGNIHLTRDEEAFVKPHVFLLPIKGGSVLSVFLHVWEKYTTFSGLLLINCEFSVGHLKECC